jgi:hypothetical protein
MMSRLAASFAVFSVVTGCALFRGDELAPSMDRLVGHPVAEVVVILGPPANQLDAGSGKRAFEWDRFGTYQTARVDSRLSGTVVDASPQARHAACLITVIATPARAHARSSAPADWRIESWSANGDCR